MLSISGRTTVKPLVLTAAYYACLIMLGLATAIEGPSLPTLARHTSSPLDRVGLVFVVDSFGYLIGSLAGGRLFDRLPGHRVMAVSLGLMLIMAAFFPLASVLWILLGLSFLLGLGKGAVDVGSNTLLQWVHGDRVRPFMNGLHFAYGLGALLAPLMLAQVLSLTREIHWAFWLITMLMAPIAVWMWFLPSPMGPAEGESTGRTRIPFFPILVMVVAFLFYVGAELGFSNWIYTYALTLKLADTISAAYLTSAYWALFTAGRLLGIWVSTRLRSRTMLYIDFAGCLASLALIIIGRDSATLLWIGTMGLGLSTASVFPTLINLAGERLRVTGTVTGLFLVGSGIGSMLLPWLIGNAFTSTGPHTMMTILLVDTALALGAVMVFALGRRAEPNKVALP